MLKIRLVCCSVLAVGMGCGAGFAQSLLGGDGMAPASGKAGFSSSSISSSIVADPVPVQGKAKPDDGRVLPFSKIAIGTRTSTLGPGFQVAVPLMRSLNLRGAGNFFSFEAGVNSDGSNYDGQINLRSGQVNLDWFPFRHATFHVSPGLLIFRSQVTASMAVPVGGTFDLGNVTYTSGGSDPMHGSANLVFARTTMPSMLFGFGNMISRSKHLTMPFEVGAAYMGAPTVQLNLLGTACVSALCLSASDPSIQQNVLNQQSNLNEAMKRFKLYPIISSGLTYRF